MKTVLQCAVFHGANIEELLFWWNGHRKQDANDIITIVQHPRINNQILVYYRCEVPDNWEPKP